MCKYSIIIPVYNCEKYIEKCVQSICRQAIKDYEIILVEDGSSDHCAFLCDQLAEECTAVRTFHKANGGAASARNLGIEQSRGEYLLFIDGDDTVAENCLEQLDEAIEKENPEMLLFGMAFDYYNNDGLVRTEHLSCRHSGVVLLRQLKKEYQSYFVDNALSSACNKVFRADIIHEHALRFREGMTLYEDYDFVIHYLQWINRIVCVNDALYHYRLRIENKHLNSRIHNLQKLEENLNVLLTSMRSFAEQGSEKGSILSSAANLYMQLLVQRMLAEKVTIDEIKFSVTTYCANKIFRELLSIPEVHLGINEQKLLNKLDQRQFTRIYIVYMIKRVKGYLRRAVKTILKMK